MVALRAQVGAELDVVEDLSVRDEPDGAVLAAHRLSRRFREIEDGEAPMSEADAVAELEAGAVGTAVRHRIAHAREQRAVDGGPRLLRDSDDSAHVRFLPLPASFRSTA